MNASPPTDPPSNTRKRQRSRSMQSESSEASVKRTTTSDTAPMSAVDDIDAYMAIQDNAPSILTASEKMTLVESLAKQKMEVGQTWYLISAEWWRRWRKACTGEVDKEGGLAEAELGAIDNRPLIDECGGLKPTLVESIDIIYVPLPAWEKLVAWYGEPIHVFPRQPIAKGINNYVCLEVYPPSLRVLRLATADQTVTARDFPCLPSVTLSETDTIATLCTRLAQSVAPPDTDPLPAYLVWKVDPSGEDFNYPEYPLSEFSVEDGTHLAPSEATLAEHGIESNDSFVVEFQRPDGTWTSKTPRPAPVFSGGGFFGRMQQPTVTTTRSVTSDSFYSNSIFKTAAKAKAIDPGTLGLGNMGNTCFMNSALQCLAHTEELAEYFLTGVFKDELNPDNPLGMQGAIAESFGALMERIWDPENTSSSYSPREFKSQLQRFAPQFSGYQQHDSQELVAFLLDGLHEDLNRVIKKPYVEKPDWEGGGDKELAKLAQLSWEGYMKRNDSVIVDLFQGQYQSTLVCPECNKVSITFDPFMYLTLPLPIKKHWKHDIYWIPWDSEKPHCKIPVEINADSSFKDLRALLGRWMGVNPDNLLTLEIWNSKFYKVLGDQIMVGEAADGDEIVCYELPCHSRQSRSYQPDPNDPFILPVFLSDAPRSHSYRPISGEPWGYPTIAVIEQETAKSTSAIYDAVIDRLRHWTSNVRDLYKWEGEQHIRITGPIKVTDSLSEINANGDVVTVEEVEVEEGDIVDEKGIEEDELMEETRDEEILRKVGTKDGIFNIKLVAIDAEYTLGSQYTRNLATWESRKEEDNPVLLRQRDGFVLEFEEPLKQYFFGDKPKFENAQWTTWNRFIHPEYKAAQESNATRKKGITLQDCLEEFTKKEQLGEEDLWYCPQCKEHRQATKKFDLWKVPDVLVVHLKRFSNSRTMRDKIDALVDFPTEGLDLTELVGERAVAKRLKDAGIPTEGLALADVDASLRYDLFGVDEHIGGLGGGHYRAYALNHKDNEWYHFDDSYVTKSTASDAVNPSAYLLFYRRQSSTPLGGKTHVKVEEARQKPKDGLSETLSVDARPLTPNDHILFPQPSQIDRSSPLLSGWPASPRAASPGPPPFDDDTEMAYTNYPDPSSSASPTSSNEAEVDTDSSAEFDESFTSARFSPYADMDDRIVRQSSPTASSSEATGYASPSSTLSDRGNPFSDANSQKREDD